MSRSMRRPSVHSPLTSSARRMMPTGLKPTASFALIARSLAAFGSIVKR